MVLSGTLFTANSFKFYLTNFLLIIMSNTEQFAKGLLAINQLVDASRRQAEAAMGVGKIEIDILRFVSKTPELKRMKDIGGGLHLKLSNLTNLVDNLENAKLVRRADSKDDRRAVIIEVTQKGQKALEKYDQLFEGIASQIQGKVSASDFNAAAACLEHAGGLTFEPLSL